MTEASGGVLAWIDTIAALGLGIYPPIGLALFGLRLLATRPRWRPGWAILLGGPFIPLAALEALTGSWGRAGMWLAEALLAVVGGHLLQGDGRRVRRGLTAGLATLALVLLASQLASGGLWDTAPTRDLALEAARNLTTGVQTATNPSTRRWVIRPGSNAVAFQAQARPSGELGKWAWIPNGPIGIRKLPQAGPNAARLQFGIGHDPYAQRWYGSRTPVGGETFRVTYQIRADRRIPKRGCRGVWLQVWGKDGGADCGPVAVNETWQQHSTVWTVPPRAQSRVIRVVVNDFDGYTVDIRDVRLYERTTGGWRELGPLAPNGGVVALSWTTGNHKVRSRQVVLTAESRWQPISMRLTSSAVRSASDASVTLTPPVGSAIQVRKARLTDGSGPAARKTSIVRQSLWFGQPNLAGHSVAAIAVAAMSLPAPMSAQVFLFIVSTLALWFTGSRTAFVAGLIGMSVLLLLRQRRRRRVLSIALGVLLLAAATIVGWTLLARGSSEASRLPFNEGQVTPRTAIWEAAGAAFLAHPITGLVGARSDFAAYWQASPANKTGEHVDHAHDLWLQLASRYGMFGLASAIWLTVGLLSYAWRLGRFRGLALVGTVLFMNVFDYTIFFSGVLLPLLLGVNLLRKGGDENGAA